MRKPNFFLGATASAWLLTIMVIVAELFGPFKDTLKSVFGHHWIGKGIIVLVVFFAASFVLSEKKSVGGLSDKSLAWNSTVASLAVTLLFFAAEFFF